MFNFLFGADLFYRIDANWQQRQRKRGYKGLQIDREEKLDMLNICSIFSSSACVFYWHGYTFVVASGGRAALTALQYAYRRITAHRRIINKTGHIVWQWGSNTVCVGSLRGCDSSPWSKKSSIWASAATLDAGMRGVSCKTNEKHQVGDSYSSRVATLLHFVLKK